MDFLLECFLKGDGVQLQPYPFHHQKADLYLLIPNSFISTELSLTAPADLILLLCSLLWKHMKCCVI